jgi:Spy/CpxP family protein refolding chaperone
MAAIMASIFLVTTTLFAHALTTADEQPAPPTVARVASR